LKIGTFKIYECGLNSITKNILFLKKFHWKILFLSKFGAIEILT
jgi:hypothetical protein